MITSRLKLCAGFSCSNAGSNYLANIIDLRLGWIGMNLKATRLSGQET